MARALDFQFANLQSSKNNRAHWTNEISTQRLIVRRGQIFTIALYFKGRGYLQDVDELKFIVETGPQPSEASGTMATFSLSSPGVMNTWGATVTNNTSRSLEISLFTPPTAIIGYYFLTLQVSSEVEYSFHQLGEFILLFNPWCPDDDVFLNSDAQRKEYVLNENGIIFQGHAKLIQPRSWIFGQFDNDIVDICLRLLDRSLYCRMDPLLDYSRRNNPAYVSRVVSAMINSNDDNGVVEGDWSGNYKDGVNPIEWNGSVAILRQWASQFKPVKYGQCWVFAGVLCTVMRCLGVPTRVVTNYESAHDTGGNLTVDVYYDPDGKQLKTETHDSVWNFHVWDECWMTRKDLPEGFDGWQVVDSTPQEASNGIFCCGPASVKAIKEGDLNINYDGRFVFAEVNADVVAWVIYPKTLKKEKARIDTRSVGQNISTKSVGINGREDITNNYKYREGSIKERSIMLKANPNSNSSMPTRAPGGPTFQDVPHNINPENTVAPRGDDSSIYRPLNEKQIQLTLILVESPVIGTDIKLTLVASNQGSDDRSMKINLIIQSILHNGRPSHLLLQQNLSIMLAAKADKEVPIQLPYSMYKNRLNEDNLIQVSAVGSIESTGEEVQVQKAITLVPPNLEIEVPGEAVVGLPVTAQITFVNTLPNSLYKCMFTVKGRGLIQGNRETRVGTLPSGHSSRISLEINPFETGEKQLYVLFSCDNVPGVEAFQSINVVPAQRL